MTPTDDRSEPDDDHADDVDDEVLEPDEVDGVVRGSAPDGGLPWRSIAGAAAVVLAINGGLLVALASQPLFDPAATRCALARTYIENANDDDVDFNDVDLGGGTVDDLSCADALILAGSIPLSEDGDETRAVPSETGVRVEATIATVIGLGQAAGGVMLLRAARRAVRNVAVVFAATGVLFPIIGIASLLIVAFAVYALVFSAQAKATWPRRR